MKTYKLTKAYRKFFEELSDCERYRTYSVASLYCDLHGKGDPAKVNVVLRVDVDNGFHLSEELAHQMNAFHLNGTYYFLVHPDRYYKIWGSGIPRRVAELGFEVGLHTDHYYEALTKGGDGLSKLKSDLKRLNEEAETRIRGMVYHGHPSMNAIGKSNWDLTKDIPAEELGLDYHDGVLSCYIQPGSTTWCPRHDIRISDFMGFSDSWGWNYYKSYPLRALRKAKPGNLVHIAFHTHNAFRYWEGWDTRFGEKMPKKVHALSILFRMAMIRLRYGVFKGRSFEHVLATGIFRIAAVILAKGLGYFLPRPKLPEPDTTWEKGRKRIYDLGIAFWRQHIEFLGMTAPDGKVLEIGSGNGQWLIAYAQDANEVIGIEPSREIREYSLRKIAAYPEEAKKIRVIEGCAEALPFPENSFDCVLCAGVFMFARQKVALREISRVLKPGGRVCLTVNGIGYYVMYLANGLRYKSIAKTHYGLRGLAATFASWWLKIDISGPKAVNHNEMERWLGQHKLSLYDTRIFLPENLYPKEHLGFVTNYAFLAKKDA